MSNLSFEVKQSKIILTLACIACGIFALVWGGLLVFVIIMYINNNTSTTENLIADIFMLCFSGFLFLGFIGVFCYLLVNYKRQVDVYTEDKMYRKIADKIIFELPYENIENVRDGFCSIFFVLRAGIIKTNGKKGPRNFYSHYSQQDICRI